jgi:hypothetical protein
VSVLLRQAQGFDKERQSVRETERGKREGPGGSRGLRSYDSFLIAPSAGAASEICASANGAPRAIDTTNSLMCLNIATSLALPHDSGFGEEGTCGALT